MSANAFSAEEIFAKLQRHGVDYVAIGGIAANAHGSRRLTLDVDIIPEPATPNYERLAAALDELNAPETDLARAGVLKLATEAGDLDVINGAPGAPPYDDLRKRAIEVEVRGTRIRIASLDDLIAMKRATGRPRDLRDIADLTAEASE